jgi:hypothetical protein
MPLRRQLEQACQSAAIPSRARHWVAVLTHRENDGDSPNSTISGRQTLDGLKIDRDVVNDREISSIQAIIPSITQRPTKELVGG